MYMKDYPVTISSYSTFAEMWWLTCFTIKNQFLWSKLRIVVLGKTAHAGFVVAQCTWCEIFNATPKALIQEVNKCQHLAWKLNYREIAFVQNF